VPPDVDKIAYACAKAAAKPLSSLPKLSVSKFLATGQITDETRDFIASFTFRLGLAARGPLETTG